MQSLSLRLHRLGLHLPAHITQRHRLTRRSQRPGHIAQRQQCAGQVDPGRRAAVLLRGSAKGVGRSARVARRVQATRVRQLWT